MKQGFVIARNKIKSEFFSTRGTYSRPAWIKLDEATVYYSADVAQNIVKKLYQNGNFAAKIVPLSELEIQLVAPSVPNVGGMASTPEETCSMCSCDPCECATAAVCNLCGGEHGPEGCSGATEEDPKEVGDQEEENSFMNIRFMVGEPVMFQGQKHKVVSDPGTGIVTIVPEDEQQTHDVKQVPNSQVQKIQGDSTMEALALTPVGGERQGREKQQEHEWREQSSKLKPESSKWAVYGKNVNTGKSVKYEFGSKDAANQFANGRKDIQVQRIVAEDFQMPKKPLPDGKPEENEDTIPNLTEPKFDELEDKLDDPAYKADGDETALTTSGADDPQDVVKVPSEVKTALSDAIAVFQKCADFNNTRDDAKASFCMTCVGALEELQDCLNMATAESMKAAQIKMTSWMNPITTNIPEIVRDFVVRAGRKPSLKDLFDKKKGQKLVDAVSKKTIGE